MAIEIPVEYRVKPRRGTAAEWTAADEVLLDGEQGWESDTGYFKVGDGSTAWTSLSYWRAFEFPVVATKTASYTILDADADFFRLNGAGANATFTLPTLAANQGRFIYLLNDDAAYTATVDGEGAETIAGRASLTLYTEGAVLIVWAGANEWEILAYREGEPIANAVQITGEYQLTEDNELDYSASFTNGMAAATITFVELPVSTRGVFVNIELADAAAETSMEFKRSSGGTATFRVRGSWAGGTGRLYMPVWLPTHNNTIYVTAVNANAVSNFKIIGYKTGA